jgi:trimeric autotransporter adhesin
MSTKTLRKRIALVAVSALGFGLVGAAPSSAAVATSTVSAVSQTITVAVGQTATTVINLISSVASDLDTLTVTPTNTVKPNDATIIADTNGTLVAGEFAMTTTDAAAPYAALASVANGVLTLTDPNTANVQLTAVTTATAVGTFRASASAPGRYVYRITVGSTTASTVDITVIVTPSTTSGSAITATQTSASGVAAEGNTITVARTAGAATDGQILGQFTVTADATDAPLTTVYGAVSGASGAVTVGGSAAAPSFAVARTDLAVGSYTMRFWVDANSNGTYESTETSTTSTFAVAGALSTISVSLSAPTRSNVSGHQTFTVTATVLDSLSGASSAANLYVSETTSAGVDEASSFTDIVDDTPLARVGTTNTYVGTFAVDRASDAVTADTDRLLTYVTVHNATDLTLSTTKFGTATLTIVNFAGLDATDAIAATSAIGIGSVEATGVKNSVIAAPTALNATAAPVAITVDPAIASITFTGKAASTDAGEYVAISVTPKVGTSCIAVASAYALVLADLSFTYTVAKTCIDADGYTVTFTGTNTAGATVTFTDPSPTWTVTPASYKNIYGSTNTLTASLTDQYGRPLASKAVVATVTGRNPSTTALTTNAAGQVTWTATDASTSTLLLTDSVTFTYNFTNSLGTNTGRTSTAVVITYAATAVAVGSIALVENDADNSQAIDQVQSTPGVPAAFTTYTASLKTALGAPVTSGVLVTFTGGADDLFYGSKVGVTDANGQATVRVYRNKTGYASITATANGVSSLASGAVEWVNTIGHARYVSISAPISVTAGGVATVVATITDRWGNAIGATPGVAVSFLTSGNGRVLTAAPATTNVAGQIQIQVTSNAGETGVMNVVAVVTTSSQTTDLAGYVAGTEVAGVTAGDKSGKATTVTFTKDTSTSTADALLALATALGTRDQASAAVDAAAEATDAANAATDAANAAAEAADAATAAAQDAADAVAALSTQVSEMVAALKKQITSLTNLVIKIQKKVRA